MNGHSKARRRLNKPSTPQGAFNDIVSVRMAERDKLPNRNILEPCLYLFSLKALRWSNGERLLTRRMKSTCDCLNEEKQQIFLYINLNLKLIHSLKLHLNFYNYWRKREWKLRNQKMRGKLIGSFEWGKAMEAWSSANWKLSYHVSKSFQGYLLNFNREILNPKVKISSTSHLKAPQSFSKSCLKVIHLRSS